MRYAILSQVTDSAKASFCRQDLNYLIMLELVMQIAKLISPTDLRMLSVAALAWFSQEFAAAA